MRLSESVFSIWTATCASWPSSSRRPASTWSGTGPRSSGSAWFRGRMSVNLTVRYENSYADPTLSLAVCLWLQALDDCSGGSKALHTLAIRFTLFFLWEQWKIKTYTKFFILKTYRKLWHILKDCMYVLYPGSWYCFRNNELTSLVLLHNTIVTKCFTIKAICTKYQIGKMVTNEDN